MFLYENTTIGHWSMSVKHRIIKSNSIFNVEKWLVVMFVLLLSVSYHKKLLNSLNNMFSCMSAMLPNVYTIISLWINTWLSMILCYCIELKVKTFVFLTVTSWYFEKTGYFFLYLEQIKIFIFVTCITKFKLFFFLEQTSLCSFIFSYL